MEDSTSSAAPSASLLHRPSIKARSLSLTHNPLPSFSITASEDFPPADVGAERKKSVKSRPKRLSVSSLFTTGNSPMTAPVISPAHSFSSLLTAGRGFSFLSLTRRSSWSNPAEHMVSLSYRSLSNFILEDDLVGLRGFLDNRHVVVDDRDDNGGTALLLAATKGKSSFVRELLAHGADPNATDMDNWTALLCAARGGWTSICVELLNHGANIEQRDMGGWSSLMWAAYKGYLDTAKLLIEQRAEVNVHGQYHITPLMWASGRGHTAIVRLLLEHGAKVNVGDKYGTTALIWACRKSHAEIVELLLQAGANVEVSGMHCWTPLLVATRENAAEIVNRLLEKKPNVNATDKDGCTALSLACKEGYYDICIALLGAGAYVNLQDRSGDTNLIHAAKAGHKAIVEALLKKYADVDMTGKERKTALYWAVEKSHVSVVRSLLTADPNLEIATKEGDTPLLRAVRNRNLEIVQLLLDKKARVSAADKEGDTVLHIAMRARSKAIVEVLLRNPKHSQLLYRPNRSGETPYNIDLSQQKTILGQIFGARRLNTNEDNENMLGYELYSSALADMLSEPSLSMPITVGLYAKWGSGKSFLLSKLREEMKGFARQWIEPQLSFSAILFLVLVHAATGLGVVLGVCLHSWIAGLAAGGGSFFLIVTFLYVVYWGSGRYMWHWAHNVGLFLARKVQALKLVLQAKVSRSTKGENSVVQMIGSLLDSVEADYGSVATRLYRAFRPKASKPTSPWRFRRICCAPYAAIFLICVYILLAGLVFMAMYQMGDVDNQSLNFDNLRYILIAIGVLLGAVVIANLYTWSRIVQALIFSQRRRLQMSVGRLQTVRAEGYLQALKREVGIMVEMVQCLDAFSGQQTRLVMVVDGLDSCEQDQVLYVLDAVHLLFTEQGFPFITLLAIDPHIIIKAIELNLHRMFNESNIGGHDYLRNLVHLPFFLQNAGLRKVRAAQQAALVARNPGGARNLAAANSQQHAAVLNWLESEDTERRDVQQLSPRRMSVESSTAQGLNKGGGGLPSRAGHKFSSALPTYRGKLRPADSMESGLAGMAGGNMRGGGGLAAQDLTKVLLTDDYFSDVNPRSMRRLMNVIYVTGRLLKAFNIEFNWYHLASWVNITEQWPYRTSWIILYSEVNEDRLDDATTLKVAYERVKPFIPTSKEVEPHLEIDRDEKKFETFLSFHRNTLQILHLKMFMPFTIHLDPYLRKVIKEERSNFLALQAGLAPAPQESGPAKGDHHHHHHPPSGAAGSVMNPFQPWTTVTLPTPDQSKGGPSFYPPGVYPKYPAVVPTITHHGVDYGPTSSAVPLASQLCFKSTLPSRLADRPLSSLSAEEVGEVLRHLDGIRSSQAETYSKTLVECNVTGRVLLNCNLEELKALSGMCFGDWELFRVAVLALRERELNPALIRGSIHSPGNLVHHNQLHHGAGHLHQHLLDVEFDNGRLSRSSSLRSNAFNAAGDTVVEIDGPALLATLPGASTTAKHNSGGSGKRQSTIEKQVTLEDQAICGALQTLNEEAMEDVLDEREADLLEAASAELASASLVGGGSYLSSNMSTCSDPAETDVLYLQTSVLPDFQFHSGLMHANSIRGSRAFIGHEDSISLGSSLVSLAEKGTATPARQRTITEVVFPEQMAALNSGLRSRLSSSTSLFRAGSQKSISGTDGGGSYALARRESQRSVHDWSKPLYVSVPASSSSPPHPAGESLVRIGSPTSGWRSEQGSPRRPASLILADSTMPVNRDTLGSPPQVPSSIRLGAGGDGTPLRNASPSIQHRRFCTTQVELLPEQVAARLLNKPSPSGLKAAAPPRSPAKQRPARRTTTRPPNPHSGSSSSDDADEDSPLMATHGGKEHHQRRVTAVPATSKLASTTTAVPATVTKESRSLSAGNVSKSVTGSQSSLASPTGSSTSSLDSPVDTTDNEVYKTIIPKADTSRRENSLAVMLSRAFEQGSSSSSDPAVGAGPTPPPPPLVKPEDSSNPADPEAPPSLQTEQDAKETN